MLLHTLMVAAAFSSNNFMQQRWILIMVVQMWIRAWAYKKYKTTRADALDLKFSTNQYNIHLTWYLCYYSHQLQSNSRLVAWQQTGICSDPDGRIVKAENLSQERPRTSTRTLTHMTIKKIFNDTGSLMTPLSISLSSSHHLILEKEISLKARWRLYIS